MSAAPPDGTRPDVVPAELVPAWDLLEAGGLGAVVVDVDGGALWSTRPASERHRELGERLRAAGHLHASLTPATFAVVRGRAGRDAPDAATLAEVWAGVPEWCFPGVSRADVVAEELRVLEDATVPDPDVALLLAAAAAVRLPVSAVSHGPLTADQVRRRLERPVLDIVTWRAVRTRGDHPDADLLRDVPGADTGLVLLLAGTGPVPASSAGLHVVRLGAADGAPADDVALSRLASRAADARGADGLPDALRAAWADGASVLGPVLVGYAEWAVHRANGHPSGRLVCLAEPGSLLPDLLAEIIALERRELRLETLPITPELLLAATEDGSPVATALALGLGAPARDAAEIAGILGLGADVRDLEELVLTLRDDADARQRAVERTGGLRDSLVDAVDLDGPEFALPVAHVGGSGALQVALATLLRRSGRPRHLVGLQVASDPDAAAAVIGESGGEVLGYLADLGLPAEVHARVAALRPRIDLVAGAPAPARPALAEAPAAAPDDVERLRIDAACEGVRAFLRGHLRLRAIGGERLALRDAGAFVASMLPAVGPGHVAARPADASTPPPWAIDAVAPLERELQEARAEVALRDAVVASRAYRAALRARGVVSRVRHR